LISQRTKAKPDFLYDISQRRRSVGGANAPPQRTNINKISDGGGANVPPQVAEPKTSWTAVWLIFVAI